ncbi:MAG: type II toxin-antitoxin system HicA family toxin [Porphyrobacter sp.]|nr:type II toxin-antitoxin system HicA family toxin [Porphyrobacter sp.]
MTRIDKLYARLLANPGQFLAFRDFVALIEAFGFRLSRTKGSHSSYVHPDCPRLLVIQPKGKEAKRYQVREFLDMIEEYGLHHER